MADDLSKYPTAVLYDAAKRLGLEVALRDVKPVGNQSRLSGPAYTVKLAPPDKTPGPRLNYYDVISAAPAGHVLVLEVGAHRWAFGSNTTLFAQLCGIAGIVLDGCIRDVAEIRQRSYPLFACGAAVMGGGPGLVLSEVGIDIVCGGAAIATGDAIVGDDDGVVSLPAAQLQDILYEAEEIAWLDAKLENDIKAGRPLEELHATRLRWPFRRQGGNGA